MYNVIKLENQNMEKINISELLKDCPNGMELDCTMYDNLYLHIKGDDLKISKVWLTNCDDKYLRFATEEEKQKLFDAIKANGYKWNPKTKTLEKLIEPKFKVGDRIKEKQRGTCGEIINVYKNKYNVKVGDKGLYLYFSVQDEWELVPNKFDITTLKPFDKVLVRGNVGQKWTHDFFGFMDKDKGCPFVCVGHYVIQCIPYENNEHLLGKTDDCDDYFKTW